MRNTSSIPSFFGGPVEVGYVQEDSGLWVPLESAPKNLTMYKGSDLVVRSLAGQAEYAIQYMYFEFTNGSIPSVTPAKDDTVSYFTGLDGINKDYIRVPLAVSPSFDTTDSDLYDGNIVRFIGVTDGTAGIKGLTFSQSASSQVYGGALVASPTGDISSDIVFSRFYFATARPKLDGTQLGIKWGVTSV